MKIKNDFVTNSSTCSYILIGYEVHQDSVPVLKKFMENIRLDDDKQEDWWEARYEDGPEDVDECNDFFDFANYIQWGRGEGASTDHVLIGKRHDVYNACTGFEDKFNMPYKEVSNDPKLEKLAKLLGIKEDEEVRIFFAIRNC